MGLLVGLWLSLPVAGMAQQTWSVTAQVVPLAERTSYLRQAAYPNSDGQVVEPIYLNGIRWATGGQVGLAVHYGFAPGWSVSVGGAYRQFSTRQARPGNDGTTIIRSRAVRVPVLLNFQSSANRLSPYFTVGTLLDFPLSSRVAVQRTDQPDQQLSLDVERGPVFYLTAGAGGWYRISDRCALVVQPTLNYKIGQFGDGRSHNPAIEVGLLTQVTYSF